MTIFYRTMHHLPKIFASLYATHLVILLFQFSHARHTANVDKYLICYLASWSVYRKPSFNVSDIDPYLCTHLVYGFVGIKTETNDAIISVDKYKDLTINYGIGLFSKVTELKKINPNLKVLVSIGGWNEASINFSRLSQSPEKRRRFIASVIEFLREHHFDGLDVYWQFPSRRDGLKEDKNNFPILLRELRDEFDKHDYILTVFISCFKEIVDTSYDLPAITHLVDWINLHCFNFYTPWSNNFGVTAPLKSNSDYNIETAVNYYLTHVPSNIIVLTVPTHGFGYKNTDKNAMEELSGAYSDDKGFIAYHEVCQYLKDKDWTEVWDETTLTPIAVKDTNKISYDNQRSMKLKAQFAVEKKLKGVGIWSIDTDDFQGICSSEPNKIKFPLIKSIREILRLNNSIVQPSSTINENSNSSVSIVIEDY